MLKVQSTKVTWCILMSHWICESIHYLCMIGFCFKYCLLSAVHWIDVRLVFAGISKLASQHPQLIHDSVVNNGTALCRKDTGKGGKLRKWSRGHQFVIRGGGHIDTWQPLYKYVLVNIRLPHAQKLQCIWMHRRLQGRANARPELLRSAILS